MAVTDVSLDDHTAILAEVDRVTRSNILRGSEALCRLLRYFAEHSVAHSGVPVKEYQLATEVFGRPADFDPRMDSTVRVQTGRLRSKLTEYYSAEGVEDPIILEIPKGSYILSYRKRALPPPLVDAARAGDTPVARNEAAVLASAAAASLQNNGRLKLQLRLLGAVCALLVIVVCLGSYKYESLETKASAGAAPPAMRLFWAPFTQSADPPWLIFSNAEFVGKPQVSMRYFDPALDSRTEILDHYTGVGEVLGVAELSRMFARLNRGVRIKRGLLLSLDDVKNNDVIFIGSPAENLSLREIPTNADFVFRKIEDGDRKGDQEVVNLRPKPGERASFRASRSLPIAEDFSVISLVPGINPSRWMLVLAGTTTMGTQAAAELVCREGDLKNLLDHLPGHGNQPAPFEAVFQVRITGGVPVSSNMVAFHLISR